MTFTILENFPEDLLQKLKDIQSRPNGNMITNLPNWNDHPEREILEKFR